MCRAIVGRYLGNASQPAPIQLGIKPYPWPSFTIDPAAGLAAALFNLLIVFAFLAPARAIVVTIVREKELRLREGMRILGLTVRLEVLTWEEVQRDFTALPDLLIMLAFLVPARAIMVTIVRNKELRLREGMRILGLTVLLKPSISSDNP